MFSSKKLILRDVEKSVKQIHADFSLVVKEFFIYKQNISSFLSTKTFRFAMVKAVLSQTNRKKAYKSVW